MLSIKLLPEESHYFHLLNDFVTLQQVQRFWLFSNCHCKNMHADMSIPKIPVCRGIYLASNCSFWISEWKHFVDKITSGSMALLETVFLYFQTNRARKIENKKFGRKKRFPQFLLCMYVCVCVCVFVCLFVCWCSTDVIV